MKFFERGAARRPIPWPYKGDSEIAVSIAAVATAVLFLGVTAYQGSRYYDAGVRDVFWVGAAAGHLVVAGLMLTAATLYRWGYARRVVTAVGGAAGVVGLFFAALPPVAAGLGWLTCVLATLFGMSLYAALAGWAVLAARHLPMWWSGWGHREEF